MCMRPFCNDFARYLYKNMNTYELYMYTVTIGSRYSNFGSAPIKNTRRFFEDKNYIFE